VASRTRAIFTTLKNTLQPGTLAHGWISPAFGSASRFHEGANRTWLLVAAFDGARAGVAATRIAARCTLAAATLPAPVAVLLEGSRVSAPAGSTLRAHGGSCGGGAGSAGSTGGPPGRHLAAPTAAVAEHRAASAQGTQPSEGRRRDDNRQGVIQSGRSRRLPTTSTSHACARRIGARARTARLGSTGKRATRTQRIWFRVRFEPNVLLATQTRPTPTSAGSSGRRPAEDHARVRNLLLLEHYLANELTTTTRTKFPSDAATRKRMIFIR
jgi:hypothetical protein